MWPGFTVLTHFLHSNLHWIRANPRWDQWSLISLMTHSRLALSLLVVHWGIYAKPERFVPCYLMLCGSTWLSLLFLFFCSWHLLFWQDSFLQRSQVVICQCPGNQILAWSEFAGWVYFFFGPFISVATRQTFKPNCYPFSMYNKFDKVWAFLSVDCVGLALTEGFVDTCSDGDKFPPVSL